MENKFMLRKLKEKDALFHVNLTDNEIDYFGFMFTDTKIKDNYLGKEDIKTLSKKIYIAKNR